MKRTHTHPRGRGILNTLHLDLVSFFRGLWEIYCSGINTQLVIVTTNGGQPWDSHPHISHSLAIGTNSDATSELDGEWAQVMSHGRASY